MTGLLIGFKCDFAGATIGDLDRRAADKLDGAGLNDDAIDKNAVLGSTHHIAFTCLTHVTNREYGDTILACAGDLQTGAVFAVSVILLATQSSSRGRGGRNRFG